MDSGIHNSSLKFEICVRTVLMMVKQKYYPEWKSIFALSCYGFCNILSILIVKKLKKENEKLINYYNTTFSVY